MSDKRKFFDAVNKEEDFRILVKAENAADAKRLASEYAQDAGLSEEWEISMTEAEDAKSYRYDCDYLIQDPYYDSVEGGVTYVDDALLQEEHERDD